MHILVLNYEFPPIGGGAAPVSYELAKKLAKKGHIVDVVTMGFKELPQEEVVDGINVNRVKCLRSKKNVCYPWEQLTYIFSALKFLKNKVTQDNESYDVIHAHFIIPTAPIAYLLKKKYGIPYIITAHGSDVEGHNQKQFKILHRLLRKPWKMMVRDAYKVISPSQYLSDLIRKCDKKADAMIIPNGLDLNQYIEYSKTISKKEKSIVVMSRLQETKNIQTVIEAFSKIKQDDWVLDILGDGPYLHELEQFCDNLKVKDRVKFHGWIENKSSQQMGLLCKASIYISASMFESFSMSALEAIAAQVYPILSDIPAHRQLLPMEENLFPCRDSELLAKKIIEYIISNNKKINIDINRYELDNVVMQYEKVLLEASMKLSD